MHEGSPLVSVLMCVYNGEKYIREAIESILQQDYKNFEFVIVNDGSKDRTEQIILSFTDQRIIYVKNEVNLRLQASLNKGLALCSGKYIARMDADDISLASRFSEQVNFLEKKIQTGVLGTAYTQIDSSGNIQGTESYPEEHLVLLWALCFYCPIVHPSVMIRTAIIKGIGGYDTRLKHSEDYDLWTRLLGIAEFNNLEQVLLKLRKHDSNASNDHKNHLNQNVEISKRTIRQFTDLSVTSELLFNFLDNKKFKNNRQVAQMCDLFMEVCKGILKTQYHDEQQEKRLKRFVATKTFELIRPRLFSVNAVPVVAKLMVFDVGYFSEKLRSRRARQKLI